MKKNSSSDQTIIHRSNEAQKATVIPLEIIQIKSRYWSLELLILSVDSDSIDIRLAETIFEVYGCP